MHIRHGHVRLQVHQRLVHLREGIRLRPLQLQRQQWWWRWLRRQCCWYRWWLLHGCKQRARQGRPRLGVAHVNLVEFVMPLILLFFAYSSSAIFPFAHCCPGHVPPRQSSCHSHLTGYLCMLGIAVTDALASFVRAISGLCVLCNCLLLVPANTKA